MFERMHPKHDRMAVYAAALGVSRDEASARADAQRATLERQPAVLVVRLGSVKSRSFKAIRGAIERDIARRLAKPGRAKSVADWQRAMGWTLEEANARLRAHEDILRAARAAGLRI